MVEILLWKMNESKTYRKWFRYRGQMIHIRSNGVKYRCSAYDSVRDFSVAQLLTVISDAFIYSGKLYRTWAMYEGIKKSVQTLNQPLSIRAPMCRSPRYKRYLSINCNLSIAACSHWGPFKVMPSIITASLVKSEVNKAKTKQVR